MKLIKLLFLLGLLSLIGCNGRPMEGDRFTKLCKVKITKVTKAKYSRVIGLSELNGLNVLVSNGNSGYYYKEYSLAKDDTIEALINYYVNYEGNGRTVITTSDLDLTAYEVP